MQNRRRSRLMILLLLFVLACAAQESAVIWPAGTGAWSGSGGAPSLREILAQPGAVADGWLRTAVNSLQDPNSVYLAADEYAAFLAETNGTFSGIGVVISDTGTSAAVISTLAGGPAERAGLQAGDRIAAIDGRDVRAAGFTAVADLMLGPAGTGVVLSVERDGIILGPLSIVREEISVNTVTSARLEDGIGYLGISLFNAHTAKNLAAALADLRLQELQGLILDLRGNPGGLLEQGIAVAGQLAPEGPVVQVVHQSGRREVLMAGGAGLPYPLVVLVDRSTASAAEIVAGAIQDRRAGTLIGTPTYGKGTIQSLYHLPGGRGLKLTVATYLTPDGHNIDGCGLHPDVIAAGEAFLPGWPDPESDRQLRVAIQILQAAKE